MRWCLPTQQANEYNCTFPARKFMTTCAERALYESRMDAIVSPKQDCWRKFSTRSTERFCLNTCVISERLAYIGSVAGRQLPS